MKKIVVSLLIMSLVLVAVGVPFFMIFSHQSVDEVTVEIPAQSTSSEIGAILVANHVINNAFFFKLYLKGTGQGADFKAGVYVFDGSYNMEDVAIALTEGGVAGETITIPEGYTLEQIAEVLVEKDIVTETDFQEAAANGEYGYDYLPQTGDELRLQGFLFPETYQFFPGTPAKEVIAAMLKEFDDNFSEEWEAQLTARGLTMEEWVTLASIIEREAVVEEDRPVIAGVFYNRLEIGMKLQSCATVQYALGETKAVLSNDDVAIDSPYNTYIIDGLPPGPICSPGKDSLEAALFPTDTDYLYFVAKPDGSHVFSVTYEEHLAAKAAIEKGEYSD